MKMKKIWWLILIALAVIAVAVCLIVRDNAEVFSGSRVRNPDAYLLSFTRMNQTDEHTMTLKAGDSLNIAFSITKGKVDLSVTSQSGKIYTGNNISSGSFSVTVPEDGDCTVRVAAQNAAGNISVEVRPAAEETAKKNE